jgi:hypothetical protein
MERVGDKSGKNKGAAHAELMLETDPRSSHDQTPTPSRGGLKLVMARVAEKSRPGSISEPSHPRAQTVLPGKFSC